MYSMRMVLCSVGSFSNLAGVFLLPARRLVHTRFSKKLSSNLTLVKSSLQQHDNSQVNKPVVILYSWLLAKNRHINKCSDIYLDRGFDVLQVKVSPRQVLWPAAVIPTVDSVIDFISNLKSSILVHGFSVGGFVHTEVMYKMSNSDNDMHMQAIKKMKGQIFDSVVDFIGIGEGISTAMFRRSPILRILSRSLINNYLSLTEKSVGCIYRRDSEFFHLNPLNIPSLMLHSTKDQIGSVGPIERAIKKWRNKGILVDSKCWTDSTHVNHFKTHPDEYIKMIDNFLAVLELSNAGVNVNDEEAIDNVAKSSFMTSPTKSFSHLHSRKATSEQSENESTLPESIGKRRSNSSMEEKTKISVKNI
ncbi:hypothetical protein HELRODRAFT_168792 [Helobdella robusta]|uniref:AB hydrolase-1 domain-containing protein n=1 Tax=Helobdella robusta TaxID=6412 RepID=T1F0Z2_HELRO|nr:hypothetical protein HELRODRAFT_168792 [Helobdella robusta]ESO08874.1 hypothetical protein HELRODRAFT_168792 [Helobdella robusta]